MSTNPSIAIIGAGIGGLALAGLLSRQGADVTVYEQAKEFQRIGAGIQMSPNAMRVLRALGLEPQLRRRAFAPRGWTARVWDTRRVHVRADLRRRGREALRRALPPDASRRSARGPVLRRAAGADRLREEARRPRAQRRAASACALPMAAGCRRGCRHRRRRRAFAGARGPARAREARSSPAASRTARCSRRRCCRASSSIPAPSGGVPTGTSSSIP